MIFASDLDRTLIYSKRFEFIEKVHIPVESRDGKMISFIDRKVLDKLKVINKEIMFIPVTTRVESEFDRIEIFKKEIIPKYVVVGNGAKILKFDYEGNREELKGWREIISKKMESIMHPEELLKKVEEITPEGLMKFYSIREGVFIYGRKIDGEELPNDFRAKLEELSRISDYELFIQERKIFYIPKFINKWDPIKYIMNKESINKVVSAGDSLMDIPMLINSRVGIIPRHGTGKDFKHLKENIIITDSSGSSAAEDIVNKVFYLK